MIKIKIKKLDGDFYYFNLIVRLVFFLKIGKMLKTSMSYYEKKERDDMSFLFIN